MLIDCDNEYLDVMRIELVNFELPSGEVQWRRLGEVRSVSLAQLYNAFDSLNQITLLVGAGRLSEQDQIQSKVGKIHWNDAKPISAPAEVKINSNESST